MININKEREWNGYRYLILILCVTSTLVFIAYSFCYMKNSIPKNITIKVDEVSEFQSKLPISASFDKKSIGVISINNKRINSMSHDVTLKDKFLLCSNKVGNYNADLKAFGVIKLKKVNVKVIEDKEILVGGIPIGIYMETDGLLVLGTGKVRTQSGVKDSNATNVIKAGDYIYKLNGKKVNNKKQFIKMLNNCSDEEVVLGIKRNGKYMNIKVKRIYIQDNQYKLGIWIRNDMQGIGTMTYYNPINKTFGALGHGINDVDTSTLMSVKKGAIYQSNIIDIIKGKKDIPGELVGVINQSNGCELGELKSNTSKGIYGKINNEQYKRYIEEIASDGLKDNYEIGLKQELKKGKASVRVKVDDEIKEYNIVIEDIDIKNSSSNKGFVIRIIDKELLDKTGGIVQGMSGSPIIQNGKLIGAVTHVFINDPTRGYGIFIENMLGVANVDSF